MKAFEEWLDAQDCCDDYSGEEIISEEIGMKKGWRAALEWTKEILIENKVSTPSTILNGINKELREK
jgi:hypothetical protein